MAMRIEGEGQGKKVKHTTDRVLSTAKVALVLDGYAREATQLYMAAPRSADVPAAA